MDVRLAATQALQRMAQDGDDRVATALNARLQDPSARVRFAAMGVLTGVATPDFWTPPRRVPPPMCGRHPRVRRPPRAVPRDGGTVLDGGASAPGVATAAGDVNIGRSTAGTVLDGGVSAPGVATAAGDVNSGRSTATSSKRA